jgi:hypothetical protein
MDNEKPNDITFSKLRWAERHDWFIKGHQLRTFDDAYSVVVRDDVTLGVTAEFTNWAELRAWAGY